jgi:hypothetical protein
MLSVAGEFPMIIRSFSKFIKIMYKLPTTTTTTTAKRKENHTNLECLFDCLANRLSRRQRLLYDEFMSRAETRDTLGSGSFLGVIGILMQLRKVCNHPDLFMERPIESPFDFAPITSVIALTTKICLLTFVCEVLFLFFLLELDNNNNNLTLVLWNHLLADILYIRCFWSQVAPTAPIPCANSRPSHCRLHFCSFISCVAYILIGVYLFYFFLDKFCSKKAILLIFIALFSCDSHSAVPDDRSRKYVCGGMRSPSHAPAQ